MRNNKELKILENKDYVKAYKELEGFCIENTQLLLFGEFGNASFPSISDLDVFICLKDQNFKEDYLNIIKFIDKDEIRQYLFFHDPLMLPESLLPYFKKFHTTYNLNFSYKINDVKIPESDPQQLKLLNTIWTTFLMRIGPDILKTSKFSIRDKLLVLKNICQSIENIEPESKALHFSNKVREEALKGNLTMSELNNIFKTKLDELFFESEKVKISEEIDFKKDKYKIGRNEIIVNTLRNSFSFEDELTFIRLNADFFDFFSQFFYKLSSDSLIQTYIDDALAVKAICKKMKINYPFVTPFAYQFYRKDFKFHLKKILLNI
jgi:hypothetical protein